MSKYSEEPKGEQRPISGNEKGISGKTLFILTLDGHEDSRGFDFAEMATPYYVLQDAGIAVELGSLKGGVPHPDPASFFKNDSDKNPPAVNRFFNDLEAVYKLENTLPVKEYSMGDYDALYVIGDGGEESNALQNLIAEAGENSKYIARGVGTCGPQDTGEEIRGRILAGKSNAGGTTGEGFIKSAAI